MYAGSLYWARRMALVGGTSCQAFGTVHCGAPAGASDDGTATIGPCERAIGASAPCGAASGAGEGGCAAMGFALSRSLSYEHARTPPRRSAAASLALIVRIRSGSIDRQSSCLRAPLSVYPLTSSREEIVEAIERSNESR